jgi:hypothetical protein
VSASDKLRELREAALPYIERKELGNENVIAANTFVDALVDASPQLLAVVEAAENSGKLAGSPLEAALSALEEALT